MSYTEEVYERVVAQNPGEPEFHQAVKEVLDSLNCYNTTYFDGCQWAEALFVNSGENISAYFFWLVRTYKCRVYCCKTGGFVI